MIGCLQTGGAENQVVQLLNGLDSRKFEKHLVVFKEVNTHLSRAVEKNIQRHHVVLHRRGQLSCIFRLARLFRQLSPDIVQAHMFHTNLYCAIAARLARVPVFITTEHGKNMWKTKIHHWIEHNIISPLSDKRIAVSQDIKKIRISTGDIPEEKIDVITPCVSVPPRPIPVLPPKKKFTIGTVGRLVDAKDYPTLLKAFDILFKINHQIQLVLVGDGPLRDQLEGMASKMDSGSKIKFAGHQNNVDEWLNKFDLFAMSSIREGIPVAMLEAMAAGLPVVSTSVGGIPEVVEHGKNGLLAEPQNPKALSDAIGQVIDDHNLRLHLGKKARETIKLKYSQAAICKKYEKLYDILLEKKKDGK